MQTIGTHIGTVRLRVDQAALDPLLSRLRVERFLNAARLQPGGLAPAAICCIRRVRGTVPFNSGGSHPSQGWEQAFAASLDSVARGAPRPALQAVPANAGAVVFSDWTELLACLASDWCEGSAGEHWWWRTLFDSSDVKSAVLNAWLERSAYAPGALELLCQRREAVSFMGRLSLAETTLLLNQICRSFALDRTASALETALGPGYHLKTDGNDPLSAGTMGGGNHDSLRAPDHPPWRRWAPECLERGLTLEQHCLLGVALSLMRAPTAARSREFAENLLSWCRGEQRAAADASSIASTAREASRQTPADIPVKAPDYAAPGDDGRHWSLGTTRPCDGTRSTKERESKRAGALPPPEPAAAPEERHDPGLLPVDTTAGEKPAAVSPLWAEPGPADEVTPQFFTPLPDAVIETELGGLFYLINLGIFLELYGDFTAPIRPGIALSIWDFVTLAGRRLVGDGWQDDPLWQLLARLAGRGDGEAPGEDFYPPDHWRLPAGWLKSFPEERPWQWSTAGGRLRAQHPEGFLALDLALEEAAPLAQADREARAYGYRAAIKPGAASSPGDRQSGTSLERWLDWLMPYLRSRLGRALGPGDAADLPRMLCRQKARVSATATHVDVFFTLDQHLIEIRLAGLDRDPGWVPAAGRCIAFHYE